MINETQNNDVENKEAIVFDFDDNDFDFKPITKGLGFHKDKKEEKRTRVKPKKSPSVINNFTNSEAPTAPQAQNTELEAFYSNSQPAMRSDFDQIKSKPISKQRKAKKKIKLQEAPAFNQFCAFAIDFIMISMATGLTLGLLIAISGFEYSLLVKSLGELEVTKYVLSLFMIFYMSYFTILDIAGTVGKSAMGIKLVSSDGQKLKMKHTFVRAFVSLLSFVALGLPNLVDFQGKLSDTKLVK
ncbi:MAG: RDD family protein [Bacteriovoracaceae bacterium]|nr:RDD family protein [Bacteriovoracaceae bacterium]